MKYMGSKRRVSKEILPIILKNRKDGQFYIEPFIGGGNSFENVSNPRIGSDLNKYTVDALLSIRDCINELPKSNSEFGENDYKDLRIQDSYKHKGYAGFAFSYGAKWMGGWCRDGRGARDYVSEAYRNALRQSPLLQGALIKNCSYKELSIPDNSIIYCDPPYKRTTGYSTGDFNHDEFWQWCRDKRKDGHSVFVSEYDAPDDFICVWEKKINSSLTKETGSKKAIEKLFTLY